MNNKGKFIAGILLGGIATVGTIAVALVHNKKKAEKLELEREENTLLEELENGEE